MAAKLLVMYNQPSDPEAFDAHYRATHAPLAMQIPGLRAFHVSDGPVMTPNGPSPYHLIAELSFDSIEELQAGSASPEGQAAAADAAELATGGVSILIYETHPSA